MGYYPLYAFLIVFGVLIFRAFLRRGKNLLSSIVPLPGETTIAEHHVQLFELRRRRGLIQTRLYMPMTVRVTNARISIAQGALLADRTLVLRWVFHLRPETAESPREYRDGYSTFIVDREKSGIREYDGQRELQLVPTDDLTWSPELLALRGDTIEELAKQAGLGEPSSASSSPSRDDDDQKPITSA